MIWFVGHIEKQNIAGEYRKEVNPEWFLLTFALDQNYTEFCS